MDKKKYYVMLFKVGGIFNWVVAISFLLVSSLYPPIFAIFGTSKPPTLFFMHALFGLIIVYGIGYYMVGMDITKNRVAVWLGILSKLSFFSFCVIYFFLGDLDFIIVAFGSLDFIFAILFIEFIINSNEI